MSLQPTAKIVRELIPLNNRYRDSAQSTTHKLEALWEIGDYLVRTGVKNPHSLGWAIQRETHGLIKRPTIFRSHKYRQIWPTRTEFLATFASLRSLSNLKELLPLLDPEQTVRTRLSPSEVSELCQRACLDKPVTFQRYIAGWKRRFRGERLGQPLDKEKHLQELTHIVSHFDCLHSSLQSALSAGRSERDDVRRRTPAAERLAFANMCISLTTKSNHRLYKRAGPASSSSADADFRTLYEFFRKVLDQRGDTMRARIRRLIHPEAFAMLSDMVSSLSTEEAVDDYRARKRLTIALPG
jgi:hypothetical protein